VGLREKAKKLLGRQGHQNDFCGKLNNVGTALCTVGGTLGIAGAFPGPHSGPLATMGGVTTGAGYAVRAAAKYCYKCQAEYEGYSCQRPEHAGGSNVMALTSYNKPAGQPYNPRSYESGKISNRDGNVSVHNGPLVWYAGPPVIHNHYVYAPQVHNYQIHNPIPVFIPVERSPQAWNSPYEQRSMLGRGGGFGEQGGFIYDMERDMFGEQGRFIYGMEQDRFGEQGRIIDEW